MAYVDHPFSITDVIVVGTLMAYNRVGGEKAHGTLISFYCHNGDAAKQYTQKQIEILRTKSHWKKDYFYLWDEECLCNSWWDLVHSRLYYTRIA
ncbi:hypothetical protein ABKV19_006385 [Rosa sericea]